MTVYVLVALIYSGHLVYSSVPTIEFTTEQKCKTAIVEFKNHENQSRFSGYCMKIEK